MSKDYYSSKPDISGFTPRGELIRTLCITSPSRHSEARILTLGARLHDLRIDQTSVVLSHSSVSDVCNDDVYLNAVIGRVANRLSHGRLQGYPKVELPKNDGGVHTLHGGSVSWDRVLFDVVEQKNEQRVVLMYRSVDGDNGFPSTVDVSVEYKWETCETQHNGHDSEILTVTMTTENIGKKPTVTNMTLHTYFDLSGQNGTQENAAFSYEMHAPSCDKYLAVDGASIPTGEIKSVSNTPFDFRLCKRLENHFEYDNFLVSSSSPPSCSVTLKGPTLSLKLTSNQPGFQIYTGNGFNGKPFAKCGSVAIEPSGFIDAPNQLGVFPNIDLNVGEKRTQVISYQFLFHQ